VPGRKSDVHRNKRGIMISLLVFFAFSSFESAHACSCAPTAPVFHQEDAFKKADMVFLGEVVAVEEVKRGEQIFKKGSFKVEKSWKGVTGHHVQIEVPNHMCGNHMEVGERYLEYAYKDPQLNIVCNGSRVAASSEEIIKALGKSIPLK
jgi:hypothetical protein